MKKNNDLKIIKKQCFEKAKSEYNGKKPFGMYWGTHTSHLKMLADWIFVKTIADKEEKQGRNWFKAFFGSLKIQPWQK